ncbi:Uncharacterised protein [uncultured Ruminococcus sp.]|nr:Uncharacterised protein [uncultured Ruminococcus sp.]SCJ80530.1 Uncharacterised protein [uncultured Ruminococcus sp.]
MACPFLVKGENLRHLKTLLDTYKENYRAGEHSSPLQLADVLL